MPRSAHRGARSSSVRRRKTPGKRGVVAGAGEREGGEEEGEGGEEEQEEKGKPLSFPADSAPTASLAFYYSRCELHKCKPDAAFAIALQARADFVVVSSDAFKLTDLLPVCETLAKCKTSVARLCLNWCSLGPMACVALAACLRDNTSIRALEIKGNKIDDDAAQSLAILLKSGCHLEKIDLHSNSITTDGARVLARALRDAKRRGNALKRFCLTNNYLHQEGVNLLENFDNHALTETCDHEHDHGSDGNLSFHIGVREGNFLYEEVWNAITHGLGCASAIACLVVLLRVCSDCNAPAKEWTAALMYGIANLTMFLCSTLYHSFHRCGPSDIFGVLDHAAIYILIAGTYTPFLVSTKLWDDHFTIALSCLVIVWALAVLGIVLDVIAEKGNAIVKSLSLALYIVMGWLVLLISPWLFPLLTTKAVRLLKIGGVLYTSGVYFFLKGNNSPKYHVVWHIFVHAASLVHFFSVMDVMDAACQNGGTVGLTPGM
eukprot:g3465.t1